jgi:hypothetical protein
MLGRGNHEPSILDRHQTNLTERLAERLRAARSKVQMGCYSGWIRLMFTFNKTQRHSLIIWYTHGYGGGQVARDVIQSNRQMVHLDGVDFILTGHTHDAWNLPIRRLFLSHTGMPQQKDVEVIKCGGYKDEITESDGFAVQRGFNPKPLGAYWQKLFYVEGRLQTDVIRAKWRPARVMALPRSDGMERLPGKQNARRGARPTLRG